MNSLKARFDEVLAQHTSKKSVWSNASPQLNKATLSSEIADLILTEAVLSRASDIHLEPHHNCYKIRFRIDGKLHETLEIPNSLELTIIPRLKILSNLPTDPTSSRKALDGRFTLEILKQKFDFRIATFPTILGDKVAIRILNKNADIVDLKKIGLTTNDQVRLERIVQRKNGLLVVSGPTGAGKTTTLYSILRYLHNPTVNIVTLENPVEYQIDGINQGDIKGKDEGEFASGLKAILRQDPDIILVGEIRDSESAEIALRASITGHLVMTSLHANSAIGTIMRLINMGIERHLVSVALTGCLAQRLVPRICEKCRVPHKIDAKTLERICINCGINPKLFAPTPVAGETGISYSSEGEHGATDFTFYKGAGCEQCSRTGYRGRIGIFELLQFTEDLREAIAQNAPITQIETIAAHNGFKSLAADAIHKAKNGIVTFDDIYPILLEKSS